MTSLNSSETTPPTSNQSQPLAYPMTKREKVKVVLSLLSVSALTGLIYWSQAPASLDELNDFQANILTNAELGLEDDIVSNDLIAQDTTLGGTSNTLKSLMAAIDQSPSTQATQETSSIQSTQESTLKPAAESTDTDPKGSELYDLLGVENKSTTETSDSKANLSGDSSLVSGSKTTPSINLGEGLNTATEIPTEGLLAKETLPETGLPIAAYTALGVFAAFVARLRQNQ